MLQVRDGTRLVMLDSYSGATGVIHWGLCERGLQFLLPQVGDHPQVTAPGD